MSSDSEFLTLHDIVARIPSQPSKRQLVYWIRQGLKIGSRRIKLPAKKACRIYLVRSDDLDQWLRRTGKHSEALKCLTPKSDAPEKAEYARDEYLTIAEVRPFLPGHPADATVRYWMRKGYRVGDVFVRLPFRRFGSRWVILRVDLDAWQQTVYALQEKSCPMSTARCGAVQFQSAGTDWRWQTIEPQHVPRDVARKLKQAPLITGLQLEYRQIGFAGKIFYRQIERFRVGGIWFGKFGPEAPDGNLLDDEPENTDQN